MLPFILGGIALAGLAKLAYDYVSSDEPPVANHRPTNFELNLARLRRELADGSAPALAILGQPGAGKSSLLSKLGGRNLRPMPSIGIETDATDWGRSGDCVLLFSSQPWRVADVPGYDTQAHQTETFLRGFPFDSFDALILVVRGKLRGADESVYQRMVASGKPVLVVRGFADALMDQESQAAIADIRARLNVPKSVKVLAASNRTGAGIESVRRWLRTQAKHAHARD